MIKFCLEDRKLDAKEIPLEAKENEDAVSKGNEDAIKLEQSLRILRDYLVELGLKPPQTTQIIETFQTTPEEQAEQTTTQMKLKELKIGPRYPILDVKEPPMDNPLEGLRDEEIPRNLFFQPVPISEKEAVALRNVQVEHGKEIWGKILLPISIVTLFVLLILIGCSAVGIYECTKEDRMQYLHQNRALEDTSNYTEKEYSAASKIVDEVSSYSDESQSQKSRNVSPNAPQEPLKSVEGNKEEQM